MFEGRENLINPKEINPHQVGVRPDVLNRNFVQRLLSSLPGIKRGTLSQNEIVDLHQVDSEDESLEKIKQRVSNQAKYWQELSQGFTRFSPERRKHRDEVYRLASWIDNKDYSRAAKYFLEEAKRFYADADKYKSNPNLTKLREQFAPQDLEEMELPIAGNLGRMMLDENLYFKFVAKSLQKAAVLAKSCRST